MKRLVVLALLLGSLVLPGTVLGFHHGELPSTACAAEAAGSPSNNNGSAKEALIAHNPNGIPLAPVGVPGQGPTEDQGGANCSNAD